MAPEKEAPVVSKEDYEVAQQLASETKDYDEIVALRETVGNGSAEINVDGVAVPVRKIGEIASQPRPSDLTQGVINEAYEHGQR